MRQRAAIAVVVKMGAQSSREIATPLSPRQDFSPPRDRPPTPSTPIKPNNWANVKRKADAILCANMRDAKKAKSAAAAVQDQKDVELFGKDDDASIQKSDGQIMLQCMKRLDEGWTKVKLSIVSGKTRETLKNYHEVWKTCADLDPVRFSADEVQKNKVERFLFHCEHMKPGRQYCNPLTRLDIKDSVAKIVESGHSEKLHTQTDAYTNAILPNLMKERKAGNLNVLAGAETIFQRSAAAISRFIHAAIPVKKDNVKKHVQSRTDARDNPVGAFTWIAMFPQMIRNVHISNLICIDAVSTELFGEVNKGCWMTQEAANELKTRRHAPKASDSGGQYRSFKLNIAMAKGPQSLVNCAGIVADHAIDSIVRVNVTESCDIIFSPYSAKDEEEHAGNGAANIAPETDSLSTRLADCIYQAHLPRIIQRRDRMQEWARSNGNVNPELFQFVRVLQDGDAGPLKKIMQCFALTNRQHNLLFGKLPNAQTDNIQINDLAATHTIIHSAKDGFSSPSFKNMTEERVQAAIRMYPGLQAALDKLESYQGMSRSGKLSYRYAIAFLPSLLERAVTPAIVNDAFRVAGYDPYDPAKMMHNMWTTFKSLSEAEAKAALAIAEGPLRAIGEQRGVIWPKEVLAKIAEDPTLGPVIELPDIPADWEMRRWNMQATMDLSHEQVQALHDARIAAADNVERERVIAASDKAELARRDKLRYDECCMSRVQNEQTYKTTCSCKCGGKWSNDITGFKSHETSGKHEKMFPLASWASFYAAHPAAAAEAVVAQADAPPPAPAAALQDP